MVEWVEKDKSRLAYYIAINIHVYINHFIVWQNLTLTWEGSAPKFTDCFQDSVLVWGPCAWLCVLSIPYGLYLAAQPPNAIRRNRLNKSKVVCYNINSIIIIFVVHPCKTTRLWWSQAISDCFRWYDVLYFFTILYFLLLIDWIERHVNHIYALKWPPDG